MTRLIFGTLALGLLIAGCSPATDDDGPSIETPPPVEAETPETAVPEAALGLPAGYTAGWTQIEFWSGEYPNGFAVTAENVAIMGHSAISREADPTISCALPNGATYSPWNGARVDSDQLEFLTMVYPTKFHIKEDIEVETFADDTAIKLQLKAGDTLTYNTYLAEGWFVAGYDGVEYELQENELPGSTVFEAGPDDEQWLRVTCADGTGTQVWLRFEAAMATDGIERYNYAGYGEAADLD